MPAANRRSSRFRRSPQALDWRLFVNTAARSPQDIYPDLKGPPPADGLVELEGRSLMCFVAADEPALVMEDSPPLPRQPRML